MPLVPALGRITTKTETETMSLIPVYSVVCIDICCVPGNDKFRMFAIPVALSNIFLKSCFYLCVCHIVELCCTTRFSSTSVCYL